MALDRTHSLKRLYWANLARTRDQVAGMDSEAQQEQHHLDKREALVEDLVNLHLVRNNQGEHSDHPLLVNHRHLPVRKLLSEPLRRHPQHPRHLVLHQVDSAQLQLPNHQREADLDNLLSVRSQQEVDSDHQLLGLVLRQHRRLDRPDLEQSQLQEVAHLVHPRPLRAVHLGQNHLEMRSLRPLPLRLLAVPMPRNPVRQLSAQTLLSLPPRLLEASMRPNPHPRHSVVSTPQIPLLLLPSAG